MSARRCFVTDWLPWLIVILATALAILLALSGCAPEAQRYPVLYQAVEAARLGGTASCG